MVEALTNPNSFAQRMIAEDLKKFLKNRRDGNGQGGRNGASVNSATINYNRGNVGNRGNTRTGRFRHTQPSQAVRPPQSHQSQQPLQVSAVTPTQVSPNVCSHAAPLIYNQPTHTHATGASCHTQHVCQNHAPQAALQCSQVQSATCACQPYHTPSSSDVPSSHSIISEDLQEIPSAKRARMSSPN